MNNEIFKIVGSVLLKDEEFINGIKTVLSEAENATKQLSQKFETVGTAFTKIGNGISKAGTIMTATLTAGIAGLVTTGIKYNAQMEEYQMNLATLLGSSDKATALLETLKAMASTTPFETTDLIGATETMIGFGISAEDSQKYLNVLGDISMGNSEKLKGLALAFSQVQSTGRLTGQDLLQMINQGFNPLLYLSKMTGKSMATLKEEMSDGAISAEMVADAFEYATQKGQPFYNAMENGAQTVNGRISTLKDNIQILIGNLTEGLLPVFEKVVDKLIELTEKFNQLSPEQKENILKWAGIVASIGPALIVLGKLTTALGKVFTIVGKLKGAGGLAGLASKFSALAPVIGSVLGPILIVIGVCVALVAALGGPKEALEKLKKAFQWCKEVIAEWLEKVKFSETLDKIKTSLSGLWDKLKGLGDLFKVIGAVIAVTVVPMIGALMGVINGVMKAIGPLIDAIGGVIDILAGLGNLIVGIFTGDKDKMVGGLTKIKDGIVAVFSGLWEAVKGLLGGFVDGFFNFFKGLSDKIGLTEFLVGVKNKVATWWQGFVAGIKNGWNSICQFFSTIGDWINNNIIQPVINFFVGLWNGIKAVWDGICFAIELGIKIIASIIDAGIQLITLPFRFIWENCKEYVFSAWEWIKEKISAGIEVIKGIVLAGFELIKKYIIDPIIYAKDMVVAGFQILKDKVSAIIEQFKQYIQIGFAWIKENIIGPIIEAKDKVVEGFQILKDKVTGIIEQFKSYVQIGFNFIKDKITGAISNAKDKVVSIVTNIKDKFVNTFNTLKTNVTNIFNKIKDAMMKPVEKARDSIKKIVDKIKGFFDFEFKTPKIKLPKFGITPKGWKLNDLLDGSVPKLSITWNKDGAIFKQPTIFNTNQGLQGVGEAGPEAVAPISELMKYTRLAVDGSNAELNSKLDTLIEILTQYFPLLLSRELCLDSGELVGALVDPMDKALAEKAEDRKRGR